MSALFGRRRDSERMTHDVERGSNLDLVLRGTNGAINKLADAIGNGLQAIALALSTPDDNSGEVQKKIDALTRQVKTEADAFEDAAKQQ